MVQGVLVNENVYSCNVLKFPVRIKLVIFRFFKYRTFDSTSGNLNPVKNFISQFSITYYTIVHFYMSVAHQVSTRKFCIYLSLILMVLHVPPTPQFLIKPA